MRFQTNVLSSSLHSLRSVALAELGPHPSPPSEAPPSPPPPQRSTGILYSNDCQIKGEGILLDKHDANSLAILLPFIMQTYRERGGGGVGRGGVSGYTQTHWTESRRRSVSETLLCSEGYCTIRIKDIKRSGGKK